MITRVIICSGLESVGGESARNPRLWRRRVSEHGVRWGRSRLGPRHPHARHGFRGFRDPSSHV